MWDCLLHNIKSALIKFSCTLICNEWLAPYLGLMLYLVHGRFSARDALVVFGGVPQRNIKSREQRSFLCIIYKATAVL
jgi:hypothetical protein